MSPNGRKNFFISRAGEDAEWGCWIAEVLQRAGHSYFLQDDDMPHGSFVEHIKTITNAAQGCNPDAAELELWPQPCHTPDSKSAPKRPTFT